MNEEDMLTILQGKLDDDGCVHLGMDTEFFDCLPDCAEAIIGMVIQVNRLGGKKDYEIVRMLEAIYKSAWESCGGQKDIVEEL